MIYKLKKKLKCVKIRGELVFLPKKMFQKTTSKVEIDENLDNRR